MSSLRNSAKRREHKERSQPEFRSKHGLLEKKKDYRQRADDFNKKRATVKHLQGKAEDRNPDEFYFAMQRSQTRDGVHIARSTEANKYSAEELALMQTQDVAYLRTRSQTEVKKRDRLKQSLHFLGAAAPSNHTVFVDDEAEARSFDPATHFDTPAELLGRTYNRPRHSQLADAAFLPRQGAEEAAGSAQRRAKASYRELAQRGARQAQLGKALHTVELKQALAGKGRKRKLTAQEAGTSEPTYRWKQERKK